MRGTNRNAQGETIMHVAKKNVQKQATPRLLYDAKWETNCRVAGRNGSWPRLSLINSVRRAPLITAACHRHAPLPQRADDHAPDLRASHRPTHPCGPLQTLSRALSMHGFTDCQRDHNQNTVQLSFASLACNRTKKTKKRSFLPLCVFFFFLGTRRKPENAHYSTKISISIILNRFSIPPPSHTYTQTHSVHSFVSCISVIDAMTGNKQAI